jgi:hypothetical protein
MVDGMGTVAFWDSVDDGEYIGEAPLDPPVRRAVV